MDASQARIETLTAAVNECIETLEAEGMDATFFREVLSEPEPVTEVYVVEWQSFTENAVVLVTLDRAQAEAYAEQKNAARKSQYDLEYIVSSWTLGEPEGYFS